MAGILSSPRPTGILGTLGGGFGRMSGGLLGIQQALKDNPNALMGLAAGLLDHRANAQNTIGDAMRLGMAGSRTDTERKKLEQEKQETRRKANVTAQWMVANGLAASPEEAMMAIDAGAAGEMMKNHLNPGEKKDPFKTVGGSLYDTSTGQWITPPEGAGGDEMSLSPIYGQDEQGNTVIMQLGKRGGAKPVKLPDGVRATPGTDRIDLGTHWGITNRAGDVVSTIPKDLAGAEREKATGKAAGDQIAAAPTNISNADMALSAIEELKKHPGKSLGTGLTSAGNSIPGSPGRGFQARVDQVKGGAFLTAIQQMQGLGTLSNAEGQTATAAVTRMDTATSEAEFDDALADYETIIRKGKERELKKLGRSPGGDYGGVAAPGVTSTGVVFRIKGQ